MPRYLEGRIVRSGANGSNRTGGRSFACLDGLRGVAALAVCLYHIPGFIGWTVMPSAYLAVDLFFCISGFILWQAYAKRLQDGMTVSTFLLRRLIRLYPLYLISGLMCLIFLLKFRDGSLHLFAYSANFLLIPLPTKWEANSVIFPLNFVAWSVLVELILSFLFAMSFRVLLDTKRLAILIGLSGITLVVSATHFSQLNLGSTLMDFFGGMARGTFSFFTGVLIARFPLERGLSNLSFPVIATILSGLLMANISGGARTFYDLFVVLVIVPVLVLIGANTKCTNRDRQLTTALGSASYAVYLLQAPLAAYCAELLNSFEVKPSLCLGLAFAGLLFWISSLVDRYIDGPMRAWLTEAVERQYRAAVEARPSLGHR